MGQAQRLGLDAAHSRVLDAGRGHGGVEIVSRRRRQRGPSSRGREILDRVDGDVERIQRERAEGAVGTGLVCAGLGDGE